MDIYGTELYQTQEVFKYPKAGETNAKVSLHFYGLSSENISTVPLSKDYNDFYIPRIKWTKNPDVLSAQYMNRHQNNLDLWLLNPATNKANLVLTDTDAAYVDVTDNLTFLEDNSFIWTSEKDGFNHIYHYTKDGKLKNQITKGNWEVTAYYGYNETAKTIYYQLVENGSINRDVYSIRLNGKNKKRLSLEEGTNAAEFSADFTFSASVFSSLMSLSLVVSPLFSLSMVTMWSVSPVFVLVSDVLDVAKSMVLWFSVSFFAEMSLLTSFALLTGLEADCIFLLALRV